MVQARWIIILSFTFIPLWSPLSAQQYLVDSLQKVVDQHAHDDEEKVKLLTRLAFAYRIISPPESRRIAADIKELSLRIGYQKGVGVSEQITGISHSIQGEYGLAINSYILALDVFKRIKDSVAIGKNLSNIAGVYYNQGNFKQAEEYSLEALEIVSHSTNRASIAATALGLGLIRSYLGKYDQSKKHYELALEIFKQEGDPQRISHTYSSLGDLYEVQKDYPRAMHYFQRSLEIKEEIGDKVGIANLKVNIGRLYISQDMLAKAEKVLNESKVISEEAGLNHTLVAVYQNLDRLNVKKGNYKSAHKFQSLFMQYKDSIFKESTNKDLEELKMSYAIERNRQQNEILEKDRELQEAVMKEQKSTIKTQKILNGAITLVAISMFILIISLLRSRERIKSSNELLKIEQQENEAKQQELEELNKTKDQWFAMMCHDFKQPLTFMQGALSLLNEGTLSESEHKMLLVEIEERVTSTSSLLDNLLYWAQDQQHGIVIRKERVDLEVVISESLFWLDGAIKKKNLSINVEMGYRSLVWGDRNLLNLVVRNLLENAIKLSKSGQKVRIYAELMDKKLCVHIADSGINIPQKYLDRLFRFDSRRVLEAFAKERGLGINLLMARDFIQKNDGEIWARSVSEFGNVFSFCLPYAGDFQGNEEFEMLFVE
ncbi:MAG: tetratricopeptide repeat-containing sensor histidine kinase [Bacteroidia bacterium]|nr:tetratricopeptide repeat-containing sensor histidine kinase [Bacteroidia bacterium]